MQGADNTTRFKNINTKQEKKVKNVFVAVIQHSFYKLRCGRLGEQCEGFGVPQDGV